MAKHNLIFYGIKCFYFLYLNKYANLFREIEKKNFYFYALPEKPVYHKSNGVFH